MPPTDSPDYITPHFSWSELIFSRDAAVRGWPNEPDAQSAINLQRTALLLEDIRTLLGNVPITVNSGFRSARVNTLVRGARDSAHMAGLAADFIAPRFGTPLDVCKRIAASPLMATIEQLIFEGSWVHVALPAGTAAPRGQRLTAVFQPGRPAVYVQGLHG